MQDLEDFKIARRIREENIEMVAPINDIASCVSDVKNSGITKEQVEKVVTGMFTSEQANNYRNTEREPQQDEILIYEIPDDLGDIVESGGE